MLLISRTRNREASGTQNSMAAVSADARLMRPIVPRRASILQRQAQEWSDVLFLHRRDIAHWKRIAAQKTPEASSDDDV